MTQGAVLAIDTATSRCIVVLGRLDGSLDGESTWPAEQRHTASLLPATGRLLDEHRMSLAGVAGFIIGTGPGAFTGLRVGLASAKTLAHELGRPIVGVSTGEAILTAAAGSLRSGPADLGPPNLVLLLPAGPSDRVVVRNGRPAELLAGGAELELAEGETLVAVDLEDRAPTSALALGAIALDGLGAALLRLGAARLASGDSDDPTALVPEYVTLPRGVRSASGEIEWSRDRR